VAAELRCEVFQRKTLAKRLNIAYTREKIIDGERWVHAFRASGELVDARILLPEIPQSRTQGS
jgi:hypothetical protein